MVVHPKIIEITERIQERSASTRADYFRKMQAARNEGVKRTQLSCGNQAHAYAPMG